MQYENNRDKVLYITAFLLISCVCLLAYALSQQILRRAANDPQIELAENTAQSLVNVEKVGDIPDKIDIAKSLSVFVIVANKNGDVLTSSAILDGQPTKPPAGIYDTAQKRGEYRVTWQPKAGVREALVVAPVPGKDEYVAVGRSLREVEKNENWMFLAAAVAWLAMLIIAFGGIFFYHYQPKTKSENHAAIEENSQAGTYSTLIIMIIAAVVFALIGFFVVRQRIKTPTLSNANDQTASQNQTAPTPPPPPADTTIPSDWKIYTNTKHGFTVQYPSSLTAGSVSSNSVLGTYQTPVRGIHIGPLVLIALEDKDLQKQAQDYFNSSYSQAQNPQTQTGGDGGPPPVACKIDNIPNAHVVSLKSVYCTGEGGPARYAYIVGQSFDVFVDGYSNGFDNQTQNANISDTDYAKILASFIFTKDTVSQATPPPSTTPGSNPTTTTSTSPTPPAIQNFTIMADDSSATPTEVNVAAGTIAEITFQVSGTNVYHGGLDFRSSVANTGTIYSGGTKTISFKANQSFAFTPYWPATNIAKPYTIKVVVQ